MERSRLNYWIDIGLLVAFVIVAVTGLVIYFAFVSGSPGEGRSTAFMGTYKEAWIPWHNYAGLVMIVLVVVHLILHFGWLVDMTKCLFKREDAVASVVKPVEKVAEKKV